MASQIDPSDDIEIFDTSSSQDPEVTWDFDGPDMEMIKGGSADSQDED